MSIKIEVSDGTVPILQAAQQDLKIAEERLTRAIAEGRIPHATDIRKSIYACLLASADAARHLQYVLANVSERVY